MFAAGPRSCAHGRSCHKTDTRSAHPAQIGERLWPRPCPVEHKRPVRIAAAGGFSKLSDVIFIQIHGTGGMNVTQSAKRSPGTWSTVRVDEPDVAATDSSADLIGNATRLRQRSLIYGQLEYGAHHDLGITRPKYVTILRNPVDRVIDAYFHLQSLPNDYLVLGERRIKWSSLADAIEQQVSPSFDNMQVRLLSGLKPSAAIGSLSETNLHIAVMGGRSIDVLGWSDNLPAFARQLRRHFGRGLPIAPIGRIDQSNDRLPAASRDPGIRRLIEQTNALDIELFDTLRAERFRSNGFKALARGIHLERIAAPSFRTRFTELIRP